MRRLIEIGMDKAGLFQCDAIIQRGYGFVTYENPDDAKKALDQK